MAIRWQLKKYLSNHHGIYTAIDLQQLIVKKTGIIISHSNLCRYLKVTPKSLRLDTLEILCSALNCDLNKILEISSKDYKTSRRFPKKLAYQNTPKQKKGRTKFPDPTDYEV